MAALTRGNQPSRNRILRSVDQSFTVPTANEYVVKEGDDFTPPSHIKRVGKLLSGFFMRDKDESYRTFPPGGERDESYEPVVLLHDEIEYLPTTHAGDGEPGSDDGGDLPEPPDDGDPIVVPGDDVPPEEPPEDDGENPPPMPPGFTFTSALYNWYVVNGGSSTADIFGYLYNYYAITKQKTEDNKSTYGALYNYYAVSKGGGAGSGSIAPLGWHVPTTNDWDTLIVACGGYSEAGIHLKESGTDHWIVSGGDNSSGFTGLGSGSRDVDGRFFFLKQYGNLYAIPSLYGNFVIINNASGIIPPLVSRYSNGVGLSIRIIKDDSTDPSTVTDYDGNIYETVKIGDQVWITSNLKVEHYNDGTPIPIIANNHDWATDSAGAMCYYNNTNTLIFPPTGWHVPTYAEYQALFAFLGIPFGGDASVVMQTGTDSWINPNTATNTTGLSVRGTGMRLPDGTFSWIREVGSFWCSDVDMEIYGVVMSVWNTVDYNPGIWKFDEPLFYEGRSVRLVKDSSTLSDGETGTMTDYDGNIYPTICIGTQEWLAENMKVQHYNDGTPIPEVTDAAAWVANTTGARCSYNNE